jgi:IclR family transcriptional regulator, mhp operon transcriptional activator
MGNVGSDARIMLARTRRAGFGVNDLRWQADREVAALAVQIPCGPRLLACLSVVYRVRAVPAAKAVERFVPAIKAAAAHIEGRLAAARS